MTRVEQFIATFDQPNTADHQIRVVELQHADGAAVHRALQEMYRSSGRGNDPRGPEVQISNPQGSNTILIKADEAKFAEIKAVIDELDTKAAASGGVALVSLQYLDADTAKEVIENYLRKPGGGGRGAELAGDVRVTANPLNNTLVISGSPEQLDSLKNTIALIDVEVEGAANAPRIVPVKHVRPSQLQPKIEQLFAEQRGGGRGRGGASGMTPVIVADDASDMLIIRSNPTDFAMIQNMIEQLDTETLADQEKYFIIQVADGVNVDNLAATVETTINEGERIRAQNLGIEPGVVIVSADQRSRSLVVTGDNALFPDVHALAKSLEGMGVTGGMSTRIIKPEHLSKDDVQRLINEITQQSAGGSSSRRATTPARGGARPAATPRRPNQRPNRGRPNRPR
jgi:type II secretory pathway component GspD/PulD (secretin)